MMLIAAVPLSQVTPRQGQFNRLAPALLFYLGYVGLLLVMRSRLSKMPVDEIDWQDNMYLIHVVAFAAVMLLLNEHSLRVWLRDLRRRSA